ncbi:hypothetical protein JZ751_012676 [Albula glossodonta]|uniref:Protein dopey-2 n=1 Tax=Albula glossodonta TaxID=121402 RepID=A0A8T2N0M5_9TELE|nr:hypothetical protein JZ751_012676 [Albula glossodonta]
MRKQDPEIAKPINEGEPETAEPVEAGDGIFPVSAQAECSRPSPPPLPSEPGSLLGEGEAGEGVGDGLGFGPEGLEVWRRGGSVETLAQCVQDILTSFITRYLSFVEELEEDTGLAGQAMGPGGPGDSWGSCMPDRPALQTVECPSGDRGSRAVGQQETGEGPSAQVAQGSVEDTLPPWLRSLMLCCVLEDPSVQHAAVSCVLELLRRSQALLLLLQDKGRRHGHSDHSPFCGRLQTLAIPPVTHAILTTIANSTDFYQHVAQVLWGQLDAEQRNLHVPSVDLFYRLHVLAPSPSIQTNVNTLFNRCFDRSLLVVLDGLNSQDGSLSAVSQSWLVRALSLNDVQLSCRGRSFSEDSTGSADAMATDDQSEDSLLSCISIVDREALWAELEGTPETTPPAEDRIEKKEQGEETGQRDEEEGQESEPTQLAQLCTANTVLCPNSPWLCPSEAGQQFDTAPPGGTGGAEVLWATPTSILQPAPPPQHAPAAAHLRAAAVSVRAMGGNREVRVKSAELLALLMQQLGSEARGGATAAEIVREVLWGCRVQRYALLALCVSMYVTQKEGSVEGLGMGPGEGLLEQGGGVSEEHLINLGGGGVLGEQALQVELLKLLQVLISLEHQVWPGGGGAGAGAGAGQEGVSPLGRAWQAAALFQQSARSLQYVQTRPLPAQAMLVSAAARALQPRYGYALHGHWVALMSASLPYLGSSLATISAPFITQICKNLDELVTQHLSESRLLAQPDTPEAENLTTSWSVRRESIAPDYLLMLLEGLTSITHYCLLENRRSPVVPDPADLRNARDIMLDEFPRMLNSMAMLWHVILRQKVLGFLNPLTEEFGVRVMASVGIVWGSQSDMCINNKNKILPIANEIQQTVVGLIKSLSALSTNTILQLIREVLKTKPPRAKREQLPMPPHGYFLLLGILNDFVSRAPNLDSRKYSRDLQEVTQQVLEAVGMVAGSSLEQTSWLSRNLEVKAPRKDPELPSLYDPNPPADAIATVTCHSDQALSLLAEVLAPLLDVVFRSNEKEKATPLISRLLEYVFPYLRNHRVYNAAGFSASARLLSSLSDWVSTIDHLLTYEKTMFKDLTSTQSPSLFSNQEQRALLLKRQAFAMFSGEPDQYCPYLPLIQERLTESLRVGQTPLVMSQIFLLFRVLLLRTSPQHLISLWPVMVTELIHVFVKLEKDLLEGQEVARNPNKGWGVSGTRERNGPVQGTRERSRPPLDLPQSELEMYLSACKLLDSMLCFPPERIPLFQMVLEGLHYRYPELSGAGEHAGVEHLEFPLLTLNALSSIAQLEPFFRVLSCAPAGPTAADWPQAMASHTAQNGSSILSKLNHVCMEDFLENMDS